MKNITLLHLTCFSLLLIIFETNFSNFISSSSPKPDLSIIKPQSDLPCPYLGSIGTPAEDYLEVCKNTEFTVMIYNVNHGPESYVEINWQFSPAGEEDWTDIEDSEFHYYTAEDGIQESTDFRYRVICIESNEAFYTDVIQVEVLPDLECYCIPENINCNVDQINNVKLSGETVTLNNDSECSENGYGDYTDLAAPDLFPSNTYTLNVYAESDIPNYLDVKAWIDFNEDGEFSEDEMIGNSYGNNFENGSVEFDFAVPESADIGTYRMRIKTAYGDFVTCSHSMFGEVEDYTIEILPLSQCTDDLVPQIAYNHNLHVLENEPFLVEVSQSENYSAGINGKWQTSLEGQNQWEDIADAQANKIAFSVEEGIETSMDFRYTLSCMYSNHSVSSNVIEVKVETEADYCIPENANGCGSSYISNITLAGDNITLTSDSECSADGYGNYTSLTPPDLTPGETYSLQASISNSFQNFIAWIDFNQDGEFSYDEQIVQTSSSYFSNYEFTIPETAKAGYARMRVRMLDNAPYFSACSPSSKGEIEDYLIFIQPNDINTLPTDWKIDGITENSADVSWTPPIESLPWEIMYGEEDSFDLESSDNAIVFTSSNSSTTLSDLESETNYKVYIRASLTDVEEADWIGPFVFKTLLPNGYCDPTTDVSVCHTGSNKINKIKLEGENNTGISDTNPPCSEDSFISDYTTDHIQVVPDSTYILKLNLENPFAEYALWLDFDQNGTFEESELIEAGANSPTNGIIAIEINIPEGMEPMETRMRLMVARSNINGSSETVIDPCNETDNPLNWAQAYDFMIEVLPDSCPWPSHVSTDNSTKNAVEISWDADELNDSWIIEYGGGNFNLGSGTLISDITSTPYTLENLEENTEYDFYLKPICQGEGYEGHWGGPISFQTVCEPEETPYLQDFEDTSLPDSASCERLKSTIQSGWKTYSLPEEEGSNTVLYWNTGTVYNEAETWFITKGIYLNSDEDYQISFKYGNVWASATNDLKVAYGKNPVVNKMTETLTQVSYPNADYDIERIIFNVEESGVYYFGFNSSIESSSSSFYLDDILVEVAPTCFPPTDISIDYFDATEAEISWSAAEDETEWEMIYGIDEPGIDITEEGELIENIMESFYSLQDLEPNSDYKVYVRSSCGDEKSIWEEPVSFHTYCAPLDIPFIEDFEDTLTSDYQDCEFYQASSYSNWQILPANIGEQNIGFEGYVLRYNGNSGHQAWYFTQGINLEAQTSYVFSFKYGSLDWGANQYLQVAYGMIPDSLEMNSTLVDVSFNFDLDEPRTELEEVIFTVEESGVYHFGFKGYSDFHPRIIVDDLIIDEVGNYCMAPTDVVASAVGINQGEISWTAGNDEEEWEIIYDSEGFDPDSEGIEITGITETDYTLEDLNDATDYDLYVRANCAETASPSLWSQKISFTTQCGVKETPYYEDFDELNVPDLPYCSSWETNIEGGFNHIGWNTVEDANGFSGNTLQHANESTTLYYTDEAWYFTRGIALDEGMYYKIKFDYAVKYPFPSKPERDLKVTIGNAADIESATTTLLELEQFAQTDPEEAYAYVAIEETGVYYFGFQTSSAYYGNTLYIDNISIEATTDLEEDCPQPTNLSIDETSDTTAEISWTIEGNEEEWAVQYGEEGFDLEEEGTFTTVSSNSYIFEYPEFNKTYDFYVRALCEERESYWVGPLSITADCIIHSVPFTEDFENTEPPVISNCSATEVISGNEWETELKYSDGFFSNILKYKYLPDEPGDSWFFTESIYLEADKFYTLSFKYGARYELYSEKMKVAYGDAAESGAMTNEIVNLNNITNTYAETGEFIFKPTENGIYYIGFQAYSPENQYEIYLDDIHLEESPDCLPPSNVSVSDISTTSASVTWGFTESDTQANWEIRYGESGFGVQAGGITVSSTEPEKLLENLNENTVYDVYVRTVCTEGQKSAWQGAVSFSTACGFADIPFVENFEGVDTPELPFCSTIETNSGFDWATWPPHSDQEFNQLVHNSHPYEESDAWYFTQGINLEANKTYSMKFILETGGSSFTQNLKVTRGTSPQSSAMNDVLFDFDGDVFADPEEVSTEFTVPENGVYYFGFQDYSAADEFLFLISNIRIGLEDTCFPPSGISFSNQTETSIDVSWNSNSSENDWEILYGESGTFTSENPGSINSQNVSDTSTILTDLIEDSAYDFYIRTVCSETNQSAWEGPFQFDTYEEIYCHPEFSIGCEGLEGAYIMDVVLYGENYTQIYDLDTGCVENGYDDRTEFSVDLYQSKTYDVEVSSSTSYNYYAIWIDFNDNGEFEESERVAAVFRFSSSSSAGFSIPIHIPDLSDQYGDHRMRIFLANSIFIDDAEVLDPCNLGEYEQESGEIHDYTVTIVPETLCEQPENINVEPVSYNTIEVSWDWEEDSEWEIVYDVTGFDPNAATGILSTSQNSMVLDDLEIDTDFDIYVRSVCDENHKSGWSGPYLFSSLDFGPPENVNVNDVDENTVAVSWDIGDIDNTLLNPADNDFQPGWEVKYDQTGFDLDIEGTSEMTYTNAITLYDLTADTEYDIYVRSVWDSETKSEWVSSVFLTRCELPENMELSLQDITHESVNVHWNEEVEDSDNLEFIYGLWDFNPEDEGTIINPDSMPYLLTGLEENTTYGIYIRTLCGEDNQSLWRGPYNFETTLLSVDSKEFENFAFYPNPVETHLILKARIPIEKVVLYNLLGQKMMEAQPHYLTSELDLEKLQNGLYILKVQINGYSKTFKLIKK